MLTYGIIFYEINFNDTYVYLKKNLNDKYEDILINNELDILPIYKIKLYESNHEIYLVDIKNYELFEQTEFIIFLDFHGVLITKIHKDKDGTHDCYKGWNKDAVKNLNKLCDLTGGKVVLITNCKNYCK